MESSSAFTSPKKSPNKSPKTTVKKSQSNSQKSSSATPTKNSPRNLSKFQTKSQTNSPATRNSSNKSKAHSNVSSPTINSQKIRDLRLLHKNAIDNLDFAEAANIEKKISEIKAGTQNDQLVKIKIKFSETIEDHILTYKQRLQDLEKLKEENTYHFRSQINTAFENLKSKQMKEMIELEKLYANERLKETQRIFPQYNSIILQAKSAGALHDYKSAQEFQNSALQVSQDMLDKRLVLIDKDYEQKNEALLQKHTKEIILLVKRLEDGLKKIDDMNESITLNQEKNLLDSKLMHEYTNTSREIKSQTTDISNYLHEIDQILFSTLDKNSIEIPKMFRESVKKYSKAPMMNSSISPK